MKSITDIAVKGLNGVRYTDSLKTERSAWKVRKRLGLIRKSIGF